jgi:hypothetical protein
VSQWVISYAAIVAQYVTGGAAYLAAVGLAAALTSTAKASLDSHAAADAAAAAAAAPTSARVCSSRVPQRRQQQQQQQSGDTHAISSQEDVSTTGYGVHWLLPPRQQSSNQLWAALVCASLQVCLSVSAFSWVQNTVVDAGGVEIWSDVFLGGPIATCIMTCCWNGSRYLVKWMHPGQLEERTLACNHSWRCPVGVHAAKLAAKRQSGAAAAVCCLSPDCATAGDCVSSCKAKLLKCSRLLYDLLLFCGMKIAAYVVIDFSAAFLSGGALTLDEPGFVSDLAAVVFAVLWCALWDSRQYLCPVVITKWLRTSVVRGVAALHPRNLLSQLMQLPALAYYLLKCRLAVTFSIVFMSQILLANIIDFANWLTASSFDIEQWSARHPHIGRSISLSEYGVAWYLAADPVGRVWSAILTTWGALVRVWQAVVSCATACGAVKLWNFWVQAITSMCLAAWRRVAACIDHVVNQRWVHKAWGAMGKCCMLPLDWPAKLCIAIWLSMWQVSHWVRGIAVQPLIEWCRQQQKQRKRAQHHQQRAAASSSPKQTRKQQRRGSPVQQQATEQPSTSTAGEAAADTAAAAAKGSLSALRATRSAPTSQASHSNTRMPEVTGEESCAALPSKVGMLDLCAAYANSLITFCEHHIASQFVPVYTCEP